MHNTKWVRSIEFRSVLMSTLATFRRLYGAGPLHLAVLRGTLAVAAYAA